MEKVLLLNSGGLDSLATAMLLYKEYNLHSLFIQLRLPNTEKSIVAAQKIADMYCNGQHTQLNIEGDWSKEAFNGRVRIPFTQAVMFSLGAMVAENKDISILASGIKHDGIKDNFPEAMVEMLATSRLTPNVPRLLLPMLNSYKDNDDFYNLVNQSPIVSDTVSCPYDPVCYVCEKCRFRFDYRIDPLDK